MTGCEAAAALPQAEIQRDALSTDEVQHALSMRIAAPVVPASTAAVPASAAAVPAVEEEKEEEKVEVKKEEEVKETVKEEEKVQMAPEESAEQIQEETPAKAHEEENATELTVKAPSGDCCIVMWCPCSTNSEDAATLC